MKKRLFFDMDGKRFANQFTVTDFGETFRAFKDSLGEVAGILGGDFLFNYEAIIDYGNQEIRINKEKAESVMHRIMNHVEETK